MLLDYTCLNIQTNIVPYGREEGYLGESVPGRNIAAAPPGSGAFEIGAVIESSATVNRRGDALEGGERADEDRKSTRLNSSHVAISYAVFCLKKKQKRTAW